MEFVLVNLIGVDDLEQVFSKLTKSIQYEFLIYFLLEEDVLKAQNIKTLINKYFSKCEILDMRVITGESGAARQFAMGFSSIKTNRLMFQSVNTIKELKSLLKLQLINKTYKYIEM